MTVKLNSPAINLRALVTHVMSWKPYPKRYTFDYDFNGTETTKALPTGWKPYAVYLNGEREREGAGNDYELKFDGVAWSVVWANAPNNTSYTQIDAESYDATY